MMMTNYITEYKTVADEMKQYAASNMQTAQYIIKNNKQFIKSEVPTHSK